MDDRREANGKPRRRIRDKPDPRLSRSLEYGLAMLECFTPDRPALGIADMAQEIGIGRSTAHRYALTLVMLGYLEQDPRRKYRLAARAQEPGMAAIAIARRATPVGSVLEELRDWTGHTVSMGVLDRARALYVHRLLGHGPNQYAADLDLGAAASVPLHCTAVGKALLASLPDDARADLIAELTLSRHGPRSITNKRKLASELEEVRARGLAFSDEELATGVRAIATQISATALEPAAIEVTVPAAAGTLAQMLHDVAPLLVRAAQRISRAAKAVEESGS
jgi:DNA-binding IclR family transcriptional regulator